MDATLTPSDIESWWRELDARETQTKIANLAAVELAKRYHSLDGGDKAVFEATMIDWLKSDVGRKQFTSLAVVASCSMVAALPLLRELAAKLETESNAFISHRVAGHESAHRPTGGDRGS